MTSISRLAQKKLWYIVPCTFLIRFLSSPRLFTIFCRLTSIISSLLDLRSNLLSSLAFNLFAEFKLADILNKVMLELLKATLDDRMLDRTVYARSERVKKRLRDAFPSNGDDSTRVKRIRIIGADDYQTMGDFTDNVECPLMEVDRLEPRPSKEAETS
ncbi:hypothetical protein F5884DRAFT_858034 [Xylogone sp. PMI_703]|nr:hypothetical protein F5884DRAFT_858034 [Xylogone sp. PMI_703]